MSLGKILACGNIALSLGASIGYAYSADWRHAIYWLGAVILTAAVTF